MSAWLIGIVGVVSLGVLIEVLLPEGENSTYIKGIFSIIVIFVIISPLPKLAKGEKLDGFSPTGNIIEIDEEYYYSVKDSVQLSVKENLEKKLKEKGYNDLSIDIQFDEEYIYLIDTISINAKDMSEMEWQELEQYIYSQVGKVKISKLAT